MAENSYTDLKIVLILTFLSVVFLFIPILNKFPQNIAAYFLLLFLLPGYSLLCAIKPRVNEMVVGTRILLSIGLGVILVGAIYLLWTYTPLMLYLTPLITYLNPLEAYVSLLEAYIPIAFMLSAIFTVDMVLIAWARRKGSVPVSDTEVPEVTKRYLYCEKCKGFYELEEDESPNDFESCQCGGKLTYTEKRAKNKEHPAMQEQEIELVAQKRFNHLDLLLVLLASIICLAVLQLANQPNYTTVVEFILILFLPGYALISVIYPRKDYINSPNRVVYSFASSIAITTVVGMVLNYTPYNMISSILEVLSVLTIILLLVAYFRRNSAGKVNSFGVNLQGVYDVFGGFFRESRIENILSVMLVISLVLMVSTTYITANPTESKPYTDFSVLGADGNAVNSINITSGDSGNLTISILNHENKKTTYRLLVTSDGNVQTDETLTLDDKQKMDVNFNFTAGDPGTRNLEFNLYKLPDENNIYKSINIPLIVTENIQENI